MTGRDPFVVLGLAPNATLDEVRAARRALAKAAHPDHGGDAAWMSEINAAFDAAIRHVTGRPARTSSPAPAPPDHSSPPPSPARGSRRRDFRFGVEHDIPSFVIDALPVEAFEALLVVASWIGDVLVDDPPYVLEVHLHEPSPCWCRLDLVPDAGASTVSLMVARVDGEPAPTAEEVRDTWVTHLNQLGSSEA